MPIYMDIHTVPGVKARDVAEAHTKDLLHQHEYGCKCMTYWIDETRETIFCLIEAPEKAAVEDMHRKAHGLVPHKVIEVSSSIVESFLGRIYDPEDATVSQDGLKVFHEPSFRILLLTKTLDPILLQHSLGKDAASTLLNTHHTKIKKIAAAYNGREVEHAGTGFMFSFAFANKAVECALAINKEITDDEAKAVDFRMSISGGEPIATSNKLFGDAIHLAEHICSLTHNRQIGISSSVKALAAKNNEFNSNDFFSLSRQEEELLVSIYSILDEHWQDADFDVEEYCQAMAMSNSQLYRKTIGLTGMSPNQLLKEYRLEKAKEMMKQRQYNISQITFDAGFASPSYFTKCFKKKYGLLPMTYLEFAR